MRLTRSQWYILSLSILTVILGVATNLATDQLPNWLMPYTWLSWPLLGVFTVFFVVLSLCQPSQGASTQHSNIDKQRNPDKKTRHGRIPQSDWVAIPVPPIIDRDTFEAAQAQMRENFRHSRRNRQHDYLFLGGRLRCGQCGCAMTGQVAGHSRERYRCGRRPYQDGAAVHTQRSVLASAVEPVVWQAVERVLRDPALIATELERRRQGTSTQQTDIAHERQQYRLQLARCEKDFKRWEAAYVGEAIDLDDFKAKKADIALRRTRLEQELARLEEQQRFLEQVDFETAFLADYCTRVRQTLHRFDQMEQRNALEALNIIVTWHPEKPLLIHGSVPVCIANNATP